MWISYFDEWSDLEADYLRIVTWFFNFKTSSCCFSRFDSWVFVLVNFSVSSFNFLSRRALEDRISTRDCYSSFSIIFSFTRASSLSFYTVKFSYFVSFLNKLILPFISSISLKCTFSRKFLSFSPKLTVEVLTSFNLRSLESFSIWFSSISFSWSYKYLISCNCYWASDWTRLRSDSTKNLFWSIWR